MKKTKAIKLVSLIIILMVLFSGCDAHIGKWECSKCRKSWIGTAYYGRSYSDVLCEECAVDYWYMLPIEDKKITKKIKKESNSKETTHADPNVYQSEKDAFEAEQSNAIAESIAEAENVQDETYDKYVKKVGKTKKNAQLVIEVKRSEEDLGREFWKFEFDKNGKYKTKIEYYFLPTAEQYNAKVQIAKDIDGLSLVEKDKDANLVVIKNNKFNGQSFDKMYKSYKNELVAEQGYIVVE